MPSSARDNADLSTVDGDNGTFDTLEESAIRMSPSLTSRVESGMHGVISGRNDKGAAIDPQASIRVDGVISRINRKGSAIDV